SRSAAFGETGCGPPFGKGERGPHAEPPRRRGRAESRGGPRQAQPCAVGLFCRPLLLFFLCGSAPLREASSAQGCFPLVPRRGRRTLQGALPPGTRRGAGLCRLPGGSGGRTEGSASFRPFLFRTLPTVPRLTGPVRGRRLCAGARGVLLPSPRQHER